MGECPEHSVRWLDRRLVPRQRLARLLVPQCWLDQQIVPRLRFALNIVP